MQRYHFPGKLIRLFEATTNMVQCKVRVSKSMSESFVSHRDLGTGDRLSCLLLNIALESVIRSVGLDSDIHGTILYRSLQFLDLANDIDIIGRTAAKVCEAFTRLKCEAASIGLRIKATQPKYLLAGNSYHLGSIILVDGDNLESSAILGRSLLRTTTSATKSGDALCRIIDHTTAFADCLDPEDVETPQNVRYIAHGFAWMTLYGYESWTI